MLGMPAFSMVTPVCDGIQAAQVRRFGFAGLKFSESWAEFRQASICCGGQKVELSMTISTGQMLELISLESTEDFVCECPIVGKFYREFHSSGDIIWRTTLDGHGDSS